PGPSRPPGLAPERPALPQRGRRRRRPSTIAQRRRRLVVALGALVVLALIIVSGLGGGLPQPPAPSVADSAGPGDPFAYRSSQEADFVARATAGDARPLFVLSPGGVMATAARVAAFRGRIERATAGSGIDPNLVEGLVFLESAGRPQAIAGSDPADAAGLTQILAATGQSLLGMHIDLARSRRLTRQIDAVAGGARSGHLGRLLARRAAADDRFDPSKALAATVRYLKIAEQQFGRQDLAIESYHMGIGNLHQVLSAYDGGRSVPYAQLYFDSAPTRHAAAYRLLASFGDDSWTYYWRVLAAVGIMHLWRTDRVALSRVNDLETADDAGGSMLHPHVAPFADPAALAAAYQSRAIVPLPSNAAALGLVVDPSMGTGAKGVGAPRSLYRGLRPEALRFLIQLAAQVRRVSGVRAPLRIAATVQDEKFQTQTGSSDPLAATGWSFAVERRYASRAQAVAFQAVLDRLQSLNLIAWAREPDVIRVTVASDAVSWLRRG
ncbi:MAG: transglycosylase SLT domain-containing protein, partial [Solirubrobacteraceae bacterium]